MRKRLLVPVLIIFNFCIIVATNIQAQDLKGIAYKFSPHSHPIQMAKSALEKIIKGTVTDEKGIGISGVTVSINGSGIGTATDAKGNYSLTVPDERLADSLLFSSIGYEEQYAAINGQSVINIILLQDISALNQVVVIGYGTQRRTTVTASIASVSMKEIKDMPVSNVATALQGKVPGIIVQQNNGAPGSTPRLRLGAWALLVQETHL